MKVNRIACAVGICLCFAFVCQIAHPQAVSTAKPPANVRIGGWALTNNGNLVKNFEYTGTCPVQLQFAWDVIPNEPTIIRYHFNRSDGAHANAVQKYVQKGNTSVNVIKTWDLGANTPEFKDFKGWEELVMDLPNRVSQKINFTLHCR